MIQMPHGGEDDFAILLALASAAATSVAMIGLHKLSGVNPNAVVVHFSAVATAASASAFFLFDRRPSAAPFYRPDALLLLLGVGLTASAGQMLLTRAFAHGDPSRVSVVGLSQVVFTLAIDVVVSDHHVTPLDRRYTADPADGRVMMVAGIRTGSAWTAGSSLDVAPPPTRPEK